MVIYLFAFLIIAILVGMMAVGVLAGRAPIAGGCGGLDRLGMECGMGCKRPCRKRLARLRAQKKAESGSGGFE